MTSPAPSTFSRRTPILGAVLVVAALGVLILALSRGDGASRGKPKQVVIAHGAPIRSALAKTAPTQTPQPISPPPEQPKTAKNSEFEELKFAQLSGFDYPKSGSFQAVPATKPAPTDAAPDIPQPPTKIPAEVRAFDGRRVQIKGFMNPIQFDRDGVKSFALTSIPGGCCFAAIPRLNEWVVVSMPEGVLAEYAYYDPVTIFGTLSVGELYEDGVILSLYRMTPETLDVGD